MTKHEELARENFLNGYNCAESVFAAFSDVTGYTREQSAALASSFGAGLGRMREVCGALSGVCMVIGVLYGTYDRNDIDAKAEHYRLVQKFCKKYAEDWGTIKCWQILGKPEGPEEPVPERHTREYIESRPCIRCVGYAARMLDEFLEAQKR